MRCVFCKIVAGQAASDTLYQDEAVTAFRDIRPQAPTHILIVPNEHVVSMQRLCEPHNSLLANMFATAHRLAEVEGIAEGGYRLVINTGADAGKVIDHMHMHLLGGRTMRLETMALRFSDDVE
jgi:histidine triad (HIT) family protein